MVVVSTKRFVAELMDRPDITEDRLAAFVSQGNDVEGGPAKIACLKVE